MRLLVVDDDPYIAELLGEALRGAGYGVDAVTDGMEALHRCVECRYALVVSDIHMPGIDGADLLEMIRAQRPGMPYVYITGEEQPPASIQLWKADALVRKREGVAALIRRVQDILCRKGADAGTSQTQEAVQRRVAAHDGASAEQGV
ncbi:MAG: response regulator [Planctomycetota bacterium]|nr:response regulator [Planctomycetota bacterium]